MEKPGEYIYLGYPGKNLELGEAGIISSKTVRQATAEVKGKQFLLDLFLSNLRAVLQTVKWNKDHGIRFYRISSSIAPHLTNPAFIASEKHGDFRELAYDINAARPLCREIGRTAKAAGMRLTFHPDLFVVLNSPNPEIIIKSMRDLYWHATLLDYMETGPDSVIVLHGGGVYGDKLAAMHRWVKNFNMLPPEIKRRVVVENDEFSYGAEDVLWISAHAKPTKWGKASLKLPVVLDIFHHACYSNKIQQQNLEAIIPQVVKTWKGRHIKMHISEQNCNDRTGTHAEYVNKIPQILLDFPRKYHTPLYLMVEAKAKERAVIHLRKIYGKKIK